jgi:hypothetical protein
MVFCSAAILAIVVGNIWLLCCGHCVITDYLHIPPIGWALVVANVFAVIVLFLVKRRKNTRSDRDFCSNCRTGLRDNWVYCPNCGDDRTVFRRQSDSP